MPIQGRFSARGTRHVPPREGLQKYVDAPTGQTGGATNVKLTGHTSLKSVGGPVPVGCQLHAPEAESFFDMGSSGESKV